MAEGQPIRVRATVVCLHNNSILGFRAIDPITQKHFVFLPGGKIEQTETAEQAAVRETLEETGHEVDILPESERVEDYVFGWDGGIHSCRTYFYFARLKYPTRQPLAVKDAAYHKGVCWVSVDRCREAFLYHTTIQKVVMDYLISFASI